MTTHNRPTRVADRGQEKILAALVALGQATAGQIADHTHLGYSTVTARLRKLAQAGKVNKQPAAADGPTSWRPADGAPEPDHQTRPALTDPEPAEPPDAPEVAQPAVSTAAGANQDPTAPALDTDGEHTGGGDATQPTAAAPAGHDAEPTGGQAPKADRRPPGKLRGQVLGVLQDHPDQPFTPHQISKLLAGASSGAIVLACRKLTSQGSARQVVERPATFQAE